MKPAISLILILTACTHRMQPQATSPAPDDSCDQVELLQWYYHQQDHDEAEAELLLCTSHRADSAATYPNTKL